MLLNAGIIASSAGGAAPWTPADITTALWLDASDSATLFDATSGGSTPASGGAVARIEDKSGNARHFIQSTSGNRPQRTLADLNSLDTLTFGGDDWLESDFSLTYTAQTVFMVLRYSGSATNARFYAQCRSGSPGLDYSGTSHYIPLMRSDTTQSFMSYAQNGYRSVVSFSTDTWGIISSRHSGTSLQNWLNGTAGSAYTHTLNLPVVKSRVGWQASTTPQVDAAYLTGRVGEVIVLNSAISIDDRQKIEGYLAHKWGLTASLPAGHPYKTTPPTL